MEGLKKEALETKRGGIAAYPVMQMWGLHCPTLMAQGVSACLTGYILEALLPEGELKVRKIAMCIGTKLC